MKRLAWCGDNKANLTKCVMVGMRSYLSNEIRTDENDDEDDDDNGESINDNHRLESSVFILVRQIFVFEVLNKCNESESIVCHCASVSKWITPISYLFST